jgi:POT family proton-dependent oligopeptide transporter
MANAARAVVASTERHPKGLYVLFATEMWERFSFYSMLAMFALYMRDTTGQGFNWTVDDTQSLVSNYLMFVYASPLVGGWIADKKLGYRKSVMLGGLFFMAGHLLLSIHSIGVVYAALACLVIGNGFFKPNVSAMVGNLYAEGSHLKDRAYSIFYMGINVGAFLAPVLMQVIQSNFGYHPAFAVAAFGMLISVGILWRFKRHVEMADRPMSRGAENVANVAAVTEDAPPASVSHQRAVAIEAVPDWKRVSALIVVFLIVIVFWMVFHQNSTTITYWGDENTDWTVLTERDVSGIISNAINPGWVILLTFPLVGFWRWLDRRGLEPSTPTKMVFGMVMTALAFLIFFIAARIGEASVAPGADAYALGAYKMSPLWLLGAYGVLTLGELMLSPMGLSLVSKVAPIRMRGLMMGGWFVATAIGNKLTQIGQLWDNWLHSSFWIFLSACALVMAGVLLVLLRPLKKAMPGV